MEQHFTPFGNIKDILGERFDWSSQQAQNICITFIQRRPNVFNVGPTLYKCYTNVNPAAFLYTCIPNEVFHT